MPCNFSCDKCGKSTTAYVNEQDTHTYTYKNMHIYVCIIYSCVRMDAQASECSSSVVYIHTYMMHAQRPAAAAATVVILYIPFSKVNIEFLLFLYSLTGTTEYMSKLCINTHTHIWTRIKTHTNGNWYMLIQYVLLPQENCSFKSQRRRCRKKKIPEQNEKLRNAYYCCCSDGRNFLYVHILYTKWWKHIFND